MLGDVAKWAVIAHCKELAFSPRPSISLSCSPLRYEDVGIEADEAYRHTDLLIKISCSMKEDKKTGKVHPVFLISGNIIDNRCWKENSYEAFLRLCEKNRTAEFIRKFYHINKRMFERAYEHAGIQFEYCMDYDMYEAEVKKKGKVYYNPFFIPEDKEG